MLLKELSKRINDVRDFLTKRIDDLGNDANHRITLLENKIVSIEDRIERSFQMDNRNND